MTPKTISRVRINLKHGKGGTFRPLKVGEAIMASDILVHDTFYDFPADNHVGNPVEASDTIMRLEFAE